MARKPVLIIGEHFKPPEHCGKPDRSFFDPSKMVAQPQPKRHADPVGDAETNTGGMRRQGENT